MGTSEYIKKLFNDAGWHEERLIDASENRSQKSYSNEYATKLLKEYGGLHVGDVGLGRECSAGDIEFFETPRGELNILVTGWTSKLGDLVGVASAHEGYITIL